MASNYDFRKVEPEMLEFWQKNKLYAKLKKLRKNGPDFYFLDGPPYTSGKVHIGTAWNKALKDSVIRYKRMKGLNVYDRAGYDMHGLPTAHKLMERFRLRDKEDIIKFGVGRFIEECRHFSVENMEVMTEDFKRLGVWMGFENPYQPITKEYIEGEWWLIKKAHEKGRLYEGERTMTWCAECQSALAKHELEYKDVKDESIFVKFKVKGKENEYMIIWTTTPWTIPFNLAIMANPELDYVRAKVENEVWIIAKALAGVFIQGAAGKKFEIIEEFKGEKMEGREYEHPLGDEVKVYYEIKKDSPKTHTVLMSSEYVDVSAGTGLVHCAPGCGPEDYEVGHRNRIPPFNNIDEKGIFPETMGIFSGLAARKDDAQFIKALEERNALITTSEVEHDYAHCWRCHKPVIYRTTKQWFFRVEDLKEKMLEENRKIKWVPKSAFNAFESWLKNLRDNSITKQRFWGTPLPVWRCGKCMEYDVVGSVNELVKLSGKEPSGLHIPLIDEITYPCRCGGTRKRIPDILDVWVDAGTASWNCLGFPKKTELFEQYFPADFILEGKDQIRGWFNLLMVSSMVSMGKPSFKSVYMHGFVQDAMGRKMSKSLGNYILPQEVIEKHGADTFRYYMIGSANAGVDINYNFDDMEIKEKNLIVLWNLHNYLIDLADVTGKDPSKTDINAIAKKFSTEERYMLSRLNSAIMKASELFESYRIDEVPAVVEGLILELSRTYIQLVREKASVGKDIEKEVVVYTIYKVITEAIKMFAPIVPFITERIYLNLKERFNLHEESIHLAVWPPFDKRSIDIWLEYRMGIASGIIQSMLHGREKAQLGVRWPIAEAVIVTRDENSRKAISQLEKIIKVQANVRKITVQQELPGVKTVIKADFAKLGPDFGDNAPKIIPKLMEESSAAILSSIEKKGFFEARIGDESFKIVKEHIIVTREIPQKYVEAAFRWGQVYLDRELTPELEAEGFAREMMRRVQKKRKEAGLQKSDRISLFVRADEDMVKMLKKHEKAIKAKVGARSIKIACMEPSRKHKERSKEKIRGEEIEFFFDKV